MQEVQRTDSPLLAAAVSSLGGSHREAAHGPGVRSRWEWPIVIGLLLIAFFFRVWMLNDVPPGLHHDEVIIGQVAKDILRGHFGIYFTAGYGHEPLYHYVVAGMFGALGANAFALRLASAFIAMLGLAATYVFVRRLFSPGVAIGALAWMSISLWPVFFARVGLRGITLPLLTTLTAYFLWRALFGRKAAESSSFILHPSSFILPGILLGLTLYTYQASRVFPIIFAVFFVYLFLLHLRSRKNSSFILHPSSFPWRSIAIFFLAALIVAAPLLLYLTIINPSAEERVADLSGPLNQLRAGNPGEVISSTLNTLGMFTYRGDAVPIYNVGGRPVFPEIVGATLFVIGLLISLWRWKRPAYMLMLLWFFVSLLPAMVTPFSPNFVRTIAAWPVPFVLAGLAMYEVAQWVMRKSVQHSALSMQRLLAGFFVLVLVWNAVLTANDYFRQWPQDGYVRFWQQAPWTQAVRALNADPSTTPIAASGLSVHDFVLGADFDPQTFELLGLRPDLKVKWFDCRNAMLYPQEGATSRYLTPAYLPCDTDLQSRFWAGVKPVTQSTWPGTSEPIFTLQELDGNAALTAAITQSPLRPVWLGGEAFPTQNPTGDLEPVHLPFGLDGLDLLSWAIDQDTVKPGTPIDLFTYWEMSQPVTPPLKIFIHLTAPDGQIVAQWDGLDVNIGSLEPGDMFVQQHRLDLPADLPVGPYRMSLGAYRPDTGQRLKAELDGQTVDSIVLGMLTVQ
jgi:4-amino-4-deoxy-L-arabinose transferase-like glycosyltransferase